jgi:hypothetical protein
MRMSVAFSSANRSGFNQITVVFGVGAAYHAHMESAEDPEVLRARLLALQGEHRDLDQVILQLSQTTPLDELLLQRLKKRKLNLKDRIAFLEQMLEPDIPA